MVNCRVLIMLKKSSGFDGYWCVVKKSVIVALTGIMFVPPIYAYNVDQDYEHALIAFQNANVAESIIHLKNALQKDEFHTPSRLLLAQAYLSEGNGSLAEIELSKAKQGNADKNRLITLFAHAYLLQNKFSQVLEITEPGERSASIETELLIYRGQALIGQKMYGSADAAFEQALFLSPKNQMALLGRAQMALQSLKPEKALKFIEQALESVNPFVNGWILKSEILSQLNLTNEAMAAIDQALLIDSNHMLARLNKAMLHINLGEFKLAEPHVDFIIAEIPNEPRAGYLRALINASNDSNDKESGTKKLTEVIATLAAVPEEIMKVTPDYYYLAGLTNYQYGNSQDALRYLKKYLSYVDGHIESVRMIALIELENGDAKSALTILKKAKLIHPNDPNILTLLGMASLQLQQTDRAETYFKQVLNMYPDSEIGITNLARSKMQSGEYESAIDALVSIKDNDINSVQIKLLLIDSYENSGELLKAIEINESLIDEYPDDSYFYQRIGSLYGLSGHLEKARNAFIKSLELDASNIASVIHISRLDVLEEKPLVARSYLQKQLENFTDNSLIMSEISDTYLEVNDIENAIVWMNKAYSVDLKDFYIISKLINVLKIKKDYEKAIEIADFFIDQNPKVIEILPVMAGLYQEVNKDQQAILVLRDYVSKSENQAPAYMLLAQAQLKAGEKLGAIQSYKKAIVVDDKSLAAYIGLVNLVIASKNKEYALILIDKIYELSNGKSLTHVLKGDLYYSLDNLKLSVKHYADALAISDQKQALLGLYNAYKKQAKLNLALPYLTKWVEKYPNDLAIEISLADAYKNTGDLTQAQGNYEKLLAKYGKLPVLLNNAANVNFLVGEFEKARNYAQQAYDYLNDNVAIMDTLAWIESRMGNHEKALGLFRNALTQDFDNAEIKYHLAITLKQMGRDGEAKNYLIEAIDSNQKFSDKEKARELLNTWL